VNAYRPDTAAAASAFVNDLCKQAQLCCLRRVAPNKRLHCCLIINGNNCTDSCAFSITAAPPTSEVYTSSVYAVASSVAVAKKEHDAVQWSLVPSKL
jgi:hypothetical protein